jgi:hypothetical protein
MLRSLIALGAVTVFALLPLLALAHLLAGAR